ncbi:zinc ribbon domain-containing protein [Candidatus Woesearchaeota archaeon]|nr:MAG: zinc ribbon domain-containing protein [Candidatus Woesearchaeota archaeon]
MPTYVYYCENCKKEFEVFQGINDPPLKKCPKCGTKPERLIGTGGGIIFKGKGFYATDYRSEEYKAKKSKERTEG